MDNTIWVALIAAVVGGLINGYFNRLTMLTRTKTDRETVLTTAQVTRDKNDSDDGRAMREELRKDFERMKTERDEALGECATWEMEAKRLKKLLYECEEREGKANDIHI